AAILVSGVTGWPGCRFTAAPAAFSRRGEAAINAGACSMQADNHLASHIARRFFRVWGPVAGVFGLAVSVAGGQSPAPSGDVTFTKDIAPILQRHCQTCHRPEALAPMPLLTYEDARPYARAIKTRTGLRTQRGAMPPWYIEKDIGIQKYKDDPSLSEDEI